MAHVIFPSSWSIMSIITTSSTGSPTSCVVLILLFWIMGGIVKWPPVPILRRLPLDCLI